MKEGKGSELTVEAFPVAIIVVAAVGPAIIDGRIRIMQGRLMGQCYR